MVAAKTALQAEDLSKYSSNPFEFYAEHASEWPELKRLADYVLATESTSCTVERFFSQLDWVLGTRRCRLTTKNLARIAFLKCNMQILVDMLFGKGTVVI